jgi:hypothetical protein
VGDPAEEAIAQLRPQFPRWRLWVVHRVIGGPVYCALPAGQSKPIINELTSEALARTLKEIESVTDTEIAFVNKTLAAELARLKITYAKWRITRTGDVYTAVHGETGKHISTDTLAELEYEISVAHFGARES